MTYQEEIAAINKLIPRVKRALERMAFAIRSGTLDQQALFDAIFSNTTKFTAREATLLAWEFSYGDNDMHVLGSNILDAGLQICVDGIQAELITRENARTKITGLELTEGK